MNIHLEEVLPGEIERRSFEIITEELGEREWAPGTEPIIKRCIHASADFDYADSLCFSDRAVEAGVQALRRGASIVTDTRMAAAGVSRKRLSMLGGEIFCFMSDEDVAREAAQRKTTRASVCMERAAALDRELIVAVGNAPTALVRLYEMIGETQIRPALVIGVPVGFVNVVPSKQLIMESGAEYIVAKGRKGGSSIAACICNALIYMADGGISCPF